MNFVRLLYYVTISYYAAFKVFKIKIKEKPDYKKKNPTYNLNFSFLPNTFSNAYNSYNMVTIFGTGPPHPPYPVSTVLFLN